MPWRSDLHDLHDFLIQSSEFIRVNIDFTASAIRKLAHFAISAEIVSCSMRTSTTSGRME
jgi:hypothetical protein